MKSAAFATVIATAILMALGIWQLHRLTWKENLLARIDAADAAAPRPIGAETPPLFARVTVQGTLVASPAGVYGAEVHDNHMGGQLIQRLDRPGRPPILALLGWVPTDIGTPRTRAGPTTLTGYVRLPEHPTWLSAPDDPQGRHFYTLDPAAIGAALGAPDAAPYVLETGGPLPRPVNNHLQYAFTWFGLAAALVGVFVAWARKQPQNLHSFVPRQH